MNRPITKVQQRCLPAIAFLLASALAPRGWGQLPPETQNCVALAARDPGLVVQNCTDVIKSGRISYQYLPLVLLSRGDAFYFLHEYDLAIQDYDHALKLNLADEHLFNSRGNAYAMKGEFERAIQNYDQAIRLNPKLAVLSNNRGQAQFCLGRFGIARRDFAEALQREPKNSMFAIWLYIDEARSGLDAHSGLEKNSVHMNRRDWPGIVLDLFLGKAGSEAVLSAAKSRNKEKERIQLSDAYFYLGERALIDGNRDVAVTLFRKSIEAAQPYAELSFDAQMELRRLEDQPSTSDH